MWMPPTESGMLGIGFRVVMRPRNRRVLPFTREGRPDDLADPAPMALANNLKWVFMFGSSLSLVHLKLSSAYAVD